MFYMNVKNTLNQNQPTTKFFNLQIVSNYNLYYVVQSPERKKEKAQWRRTINFWRDIFASATFCNYNQTAYLFLGPKKKLLNTQKFGL